MQIWAGLHRLNCLRRRPGGSEGTTEHGRYAWVCTVSARPVMARNRSNHLNVAYAPSDEAADRALAAKAAMFAEMGIEVHLCGDVNL